MKLCNVIISHKGANFPCITEEGDVGPGMENFKLTSTAIDDCDGGDAEYTFHGLTNWGREAVVPDLTPDENAIQMVAFYKVCDTYSTVGDVEFSLELKRTADGSGSGGTIDNKTEITLPFSGAAGSGVND